MGVSWLLLWVQPPGVSHNPNHEALIRRGLEAMNARQTHDRGWEAKCQLLRQVPRGAAAGGAAQQQGVAKAAAAGGGMKDMWLVQLTESRGCCFLINRPAGQVLEAESTTVLPLLDAKLGYKTSVSCSFLGRRYRLADLTLKLGGAIVASRQAGGSAGGAGGSQFIGHVLHVEYGPACGSPADAQPIINDFVDLLNGMLAEVEADDAAGAAAAATAAATAVTTGSASGGAAATTAGLSAPASGRFQLFTPSGGAVCYRVPAAPDGGGWGPGHEAAQFVELAVQLTMSTSTKGKQ